MDDVYIAGVFTIPFGKFPDRTLRSLAAEAAQGAMQDAGATPDDIDAVYFSNAAEGALTQQEMVRGQVALQDTGLLGKPLFNVENACASGSSAVILACAGIQGGSCDVAIVVGAEKLTNPDRAKTFSIFSMGWDVERFGRPGEGAKQSVLMDVYAQLARDYMARSGATAADFAHIAVKSHANGALNPIAQFREPLRVEEVLGSRTIADPLTLLMCSGIGDGASALVLASSRGLERLEADPVRVRAAVLRSGLVDEAGEGPVARTAQAAYAQSGLTPDDIDVVELHDAAAPAELFLTEELGLAPEGGAVAMLRNGETSLGGRMPINPSGGLLSRGHPVGATGCAQLVELTQQLQGRCGARQVGGAQVALAENGGGWMGGGVAAATVTILSR